MTSRRIMVTLPFELAVRLHKHRVRHDFRSGNAAAVDLVRLGLDWFENSEAREAEAALLRRLQHWGESVP